MLKKKTQGFSSLSSKNDSSNSSDRGVIFPKNALDEELEWPSVVT